MQWLPTDRPMLEAAMKAFKAGDWQSARDWFEQATATGRADAGAFALLATACQRLDDHDAALAAADQALGLDPRQLRALLVKADTLAARGESRDANVYYATTVTVGAAFATLTPDLADGVARARVLRDRLKTEIEDHVRAELEGAGYQEKSAPARFTQALEVLTGRKTVYVQQPRYFYYPELPTIQFYPRQDFPWLDAVEAATDDITAELEAVLREDAAFAPYIQSQPNMQYQADAPLIDSMDWSSFYMWKDGLETANVARCPRTMAVLDAAPLCRVDGRSPLVMFSQLKPGAHITPHTGVLNTRLLCHLPLIVPPGCSFRVGNEEREWERGKAWLFNDSIEHEAWNRSDRTRVILIFDVWRPELSEEERHLIATLLRAMDAFTPRDGMWD